MSEPNCIGCKPIKYDSKETYFMNIQLRATQLVLRLKILNVPYYTIGHIQLQTATSSGFEIK